MRDRKCYQLYQTTASHKRLQQMILSKAQTGVHKSGAISIQIRLRKVQSKWGRYDGEIGRA